MATKSRRSGQDRKRVSKQSHEIGHTGGKVAKKAGASRKAGTRAVRKAKQQTRTVSRKNVERRARQLVTA